MSRRRCRSGRAAVPFSSTDDLPVLVAGPVVVLTPADAALLAALLVPGMRQAARERWRYSSREAEVLAAVERLARVHRAMPSDPIGPDPTSAAGPASRMELMSTTTAAEVLGVSARQVCRLAARGDLRARMVAGRWRIDPHDVLERIES